MSVSNISKSYPIGTRLRIRDDDNGVIREIYGYELFNDHANIVFKDGGKLNAARLELIEEIMA